MDDKSTTTSSHWPIQASITVYSESCALVFCSSSLLARERSSFSVDTIVDLGIVVHTLPSLYTLDFFQKQSLFIRSFRLYP